MERSEWDGVVAELSAAGPVEQERVFRELREREVSPIGAIYVACRVLGLSLAEGKAALFASPAWADRREDWARTHAELEAD